MDDRTTAQDGTEKACLEQAPFLTAGTYASVGMGAWFWLLMTSLIFSALILWALFGRIQLALSANGLLLKEGGRMIQLRAHQSGHVQSLFAKAGMSVQPEQTLVTLRSPEIAERIAFNKQQYESQHKALQRYRLWSQERLRMLAQHKTQQQAAYDAASSEAKDILQVTKKLYDAKKALNHQHYISSEVLARSREQFFQAKQRIEQLQLEAVRQNLLIAEQENAVRQTIFSLEQKSAQLAHAWLNQHLQHQSDIRSPFPGEVVSVLVAKGQAVQSEQALLTVMHGKRSADLQALVFVSHDEGKKVKVGMPAQVFPATRTRNRAYVHAVVQSISPFPVSKTGLQPYLGDSSLIEQYTASGSPYLVTLRLKKRKAGLDWSIPAEAKTSLALGEAVQARIIYQSLSPYDFIWGQSS